MKLESLLTSPAAFGLTSATPLQRAICRVVDHELTGLSDEAMIKHFGTLKIPESPQLLVLICGVRSGKSLISVAAAFHAALTADLSRLLPHERARVAIVAPTVANASTTFRLLTGAVQTSKALKAVVLGEPTADTITIRRSDGRFVDIVVVAAHRGAVTLRGTWLAGFILEEVAFFGADSTGYVINAEELLRAAETRLVPGGRGMIISSPMGAEGLLFQMYQDHFAKPGKVVVVHAPTLAMNYVTVTPEIVDAIRRRDPDAAAREYDAIWADSEQVLIPTAHIDQCMRKVPGDVAPEPGLSYRAAMDPATRGNAWTLAIATLCERDNRLKQVIVLTRQWIGSKSDPLDPDQVIKEIKALIEPYGLNSVETDQWSADANKAIGRRYGLYLYDRALNSAENLEIYTSLAVKLADNEIELPKDDVVRDDLRGLRKMVRSSVRIVLPRTADGRHCDYAPAIARAVATTVSGPKDLPPEPGTPEYVLYVARQDKEKAKLFANKKERAAIKAVNRALKRGNFSVLK